MPTTQEAEPLSRLVLSTCVVDLRGEKVLRDGTAEVLTTREAQLLGYLAARPGRDVGRDELLSEVWGYNESVVSRAVDATVNRLRAKIERDPSAPDHVVTVWGHGYRFVPAEAPVVVSLHPEEPEEPEEPEGHSSRTNVIPRLDAFVGREAELVALRAAFEGGARLVTLVGPGGVGKTRLAEEHAAKQAAWPGGIWVADLSETRTQAGLVHAVARALDVTSPPGDEVAATRELGQVLHDRAPVLLLLDNLESVADLGARAVSHWLRAAPELRVLATSRQALGVATEVVVQVGPLRPEAAAALFCDRAPAVECSGPGEDGLVHDIVTRLDRLPLAIELAAGMTDVLELPDLARRLAAQLDLLVSQRRDLPERHLSLRHALDGSWSSLSAGEKRVLAGASVFHGGFSLEAAEAVLHPGRGAFTLQALRGLRAKSLVRMLPGASRRFGMFRAIHEYAFEKLAKMDTADDILEAHRRWYTRQARLRLRGYEGASASPTDLQWAELELDNLLGAFEGSESSPAEDVARLALALYEILGYRGPLVTAMSVLEQGLLRADELPHALRSHLHRQLATAAWSLGDAELMRAHMDEAIQVAREGDEIACEGRARVARAAMQMHALPPQEVVEELERALELLERAGDGPYQPSALSNLGTALWIQGRVEDAIAAYERALELHRSHGNLRSAAVVLGNLGLLDGGRGHVDRARKMHEEALRMHEDSRADRNRAVTLFHLGALELQAGSPEKCMHLLDQVEALARVSGPRAVRANAREFMALARWVAGDVGGARAAFEESRALSVRVASTQRSTVLLMDFALSLSEGREDHAARCLSELREVVEAQPGAATSQQVEIAEALLEARRAEAALREGDRKTWREHRRAVDATVRSLESSGHLGTLSDVSPFLQVLRRG